MRTALALTMIALVLAGCTNDGDTGPTPSTGPATTTPEPTPETTTPTPTSTTPTPVATTPTEPTPDEAEDNGTTPPAPFEPIALRHNYGNASQNLTFFVPAGTAALSVSVQFDAAPTAVPGQTACAGALKIKVIRPDGTLQFDVTASPGSGTSGQTTHCGQVSAGGTFPTDVPPGEWHADFTGQGVGIGWVRVAPVE